MAVCASCGATIAASDRFCPSCGAAVSDAGVTMTTPGPRLAAAATVLSGSDGAIDHGALTPGETLAGRYRILSLLGRGGMGEVYRADDLTLAQPVALKFLPASLEQDQSRLQRFLQEVRLARQISHPNVCRVYDIGEASGRHFISMEFIDGEDLASLLRRIGRLPPDKAVEIARQLCAGLAAAHDKGVLHRDLKPANVMLDGRGKVRLTDFGLAEVEAPGGERGLAGTPAYMAPELLDGQPATVRSDIYALGLVIHEIFTGKRVFDAPTIEGLRRQHRESSSRTLSSSLDDIDPAVDRIVDRCLEQDPSRRPSSALAVSAALPGGDPLAAALAAGETPSPELVAAAGREAGVSPMVALAALAIVIVGVIAAVAMQSQTLLFKRVGLARSPDALVDRAREILTRFGYTDPPADSASFLAYDSFYLQYIAATDRSESRWDGIETTPIVFLIYRQSPRDMLPLTPTGRIDARTPPEDVSDMISVWVDRQGRLIVFSAQPPQFVEPSDGPPPQMDWAALFDEARLDMSTFRRVEPKWVPAMAYDERVAWEGSYPSTPAIPVHIEAASFRGRPVYFNIRGPWDVPLRQQEPQLTVGQRIAQGVILGLILLLATAAVALARRNRRSRRGDPRGAARLAAFVFAVLMIGWAVGADHASSVPGELTLLVFALGASGVLTAFVWVVYMALEPFVRRRWPRMLIGWTRVLAGRLRDPHVGRDLLFGAAAGALAGVIGHLQLLAPDWLGQPPPVPVGAAPGASGVLQQLVVGIYEALIGLFTLLLLRMIVRRDSIAVGLLGLFLATFALRGQTPVQILLALLSAALALTVLLRFGLLAIAVAILTANLLFAIPIGVDPSAWYAPPGFLALALIGGLAGWGFYTALAGQPLFGRLLED